MAKKAGVTLRPGKDKNEHKLKIILQGKLTIENSREIHQTILETIENYTVYNVEVKDVEDIDLTVIQLLFALHRQLESMNKEFYLQMLLQKRDIDLLTHNGLYQPLSILSTDNKEKKKN